MRVSIDNQILEKYPEVEIGYLVAEVRVEKGNVYVEKLKEQLSEALVLQEVRDSNFVEDPRIGVWRRVYQEDFCVKPKTYRSSVEALVRRVVTGKKMWDINTVVDLYNCCSVMSMLPMGGYDMRKVSGDIDIRYGRDGERFLGLGERTPVAVQANHVVYGDAERVLCWLWNHKDAGATCIDANTREVVFFVDAVEAKDGEVTKALNLLESHLNGLGGVVKTSGILSREKVEVSLE